MKKRHGRILIEEKREKEGNLFIVLFTYQPYSLFLLHCNCIHFSFRTVKSVDIPTWLPLDDSLLLPLPLPLPPPVSNSFLLLLAFPIHGDSISTIDCSAPSTTSAPAVPSATGGVGSGAPAAGSAAAAAGSFLQRTAKFRRYER